MLFDCIDVEVGDGERVAFIVSLRVCVSPPATFHDMFVSQSGLGRVQGH